MNLMVTINEAIEELGISAAELLRAVMERRIPRPRKIFGWPPEQFESIRAHYVARKAECAATNEAKEETNERY